MHREVGCLWAPRSGEAVAVAWPAVTEDAQVRAGAENRVGVR